MLILADIRRSRLEITLFFNRAITVFLFVFNKRNRRLYRLYSNFWKFCAHFQLLVTAECPVRPLEGVLYRK